MDLRAKQSVLALLGGLAVALTTVHADEPNNRPQQQAQPTSCQKSESELAAETFRQIAGYESLGARSTPPDAKQAGSRRLIPPPRGDARHAKFAQPAAADGIRPEVALYVDSPLAEMRLIVAEQTMTTTDNARSAPSAFPDTDEPRPLPTATADDELIANRSESISRENAAMAPMQAAPHAHGVVQPRAFQRNVSVAPSSTAHNRLFPCRPPLSSVSAQRNWKTDFVEVMPDRAGDIAAASAATSVRPDDTHDRGSSMLVSWENEDGPVAGIERVRLMRDAEFAALDDPLTVSNHLDLAAESGKAPDTTRPPFDFLEGSGDDIQLLDAAKSLLDSVDDAPGSTVPAANARVQPLLEGNEARDEIALDAQYDYEKYLTEEIMPTPEKRPRQNYAYTLSDVLDDRDEQGDPCLEQQFCDAMWQCAGGRHLSPWQRWCRKWSRNYEVIHRGQCNGMGMVGGNFGWLTPIQIGSSFYCNEADRCLMFGGWGRPIAPSKMACSTPLE